MSVYLEQARLCRAAAARAEGTPLALPSMLRACEHERRHVEAQAEADAWAQQFAALSRALRRAIRHSQPNDQIRHAIEDCNDELVELAGMGIRPRGVAWLGNGVLNS